MIVENALLSPVEWEDLPDAPAGADAALHRVLHIINGEHYAGAERVQDLLAMRLPEFGYQVGFACVRPRAFAEVRRAKDAPLHEVGMAHKFDLRPALTLARLVRQQRYEVIHAHTVRSVLIGRVVSQWTGVPLIYHVHSPAACDSTRRWSNWVNARIERLVLPHAKALIAVSQSLGERTRAMGFRPDRIVVVPNGVPTAGPLSDRTPPVDYWTIGTVALFRPRKGLEVLLEALAALVERGRPVRLHAVGIFETDTYRDEIHRRVDRLHLQDRVIWRGFQKNVDRELRLMDLFALPSLFGEGMPMVVLEAMAAGVPIVSTLVEGVPEAIRNGVDGLLAAPGDPAALAAAIERFLTGEADWRAIRRSAYNRQANCFSDRSMAERVAQVYDAVLAGRSVKSLEMSAANV